MAERKIGPNTFRVEQLPAMRSFVLQPRILPVAAEVVGLFLDTLGKAGKTAGEVSIASLLDMDLAATAETFVAAVARCCLKLPPSELETITRELLCGATCDGQLLFQFDGKPGTFDLVMRGRTIDTWRLLFFAVQVNYPDFSSAVADLRKGSTAASPSAGSNTSDLAGPSGA